MEDSIVIQEQFMAQIKQKHNAALSLVNSIAEKLNISNDSAYRRIRCEKDFSFQEMIILSKEYDISLDALIKYQTDDVSFNYRSFSNEGFTLHRYLESIVGNLKLINDFPGDKSLIYLCKDFPLFHYFDFPAIASFKMFFWLRFILNDPENKDKEFSIDSIPAPAMETGKRILHEYIKVPCVEIWNKETINSTLNQIEYFYESGLFSSQNDVIAVLDDLDEMIRHIKEETEYGIKFNYRGKRLDVEPNFRVFYNEVTIGDNTIFFKLGNQRISFITANVLNILTSTDEKFCNDVEHGMDNIMKKSIEISRSSQKVRAKFFKQQLDKIEKTRAILNSI